MGANLGDWGRLALLFVMSMRILDGDCGKR